jgi:cyclopropane-fatty-acyl-phospholipid synthase
MAVRRLRSESPVVRSAPIATMPADLPFAVETRAGEQETFGDGTPLFHVRVADWAAWTRLTSLDAYHAGLAFIQGEFDVDGDLVGAIRTWQQIHTTPSLASAVTSVLPKFRVERFLQSKRRAQRNIQFHYDRSNAFYRAFLDRSLVYSCAYFADPSQSIDDAQAAKLDHICRKLDLGQDDTFLDIGCGWGALVARAAGAYDARALGCTLSTQQRDDAVRLLEERGLADRARVELRDYRDVTGTFTKIASVGMVEHVGRRRLGQYFSVMAERLDPRGLFLNHGIVRPLGTREDAATHFLQRRVFPGAELPHLEEMVHAAERAGFEVLDVENLRPHYALTCRAWVARLQANAAACLEAVDPETYRTWLLYLAGSANNFEQGASDIYQMLLAKRSTAQVRHLRREYMYAPR